MKGSNLTVVAYDLIKEMIMTSRINPGQRLKFKRLAEILGVSRTPVNNALQILAREGYLDFVENKGYTVCQLSREEAEDLNEIRTILEIGVLAKAIRRMTGPKLSLVEDAMAACEHGIVSACNREFYLLDAKFHASIMVMADNQPLVSKYLEICHRAALNFREGLSAGQIYRAKIAFENNELLNAVRNRDVEGAKELIAKHNVNPVKRLLPLSTFYPIFGNRSLFAKVWQTVRDQECGKSAMPCGRCD